MKRLRMALMGAGYLGKFYIEKMLAHPQAILVGVVDNVAAARAVAFERFGVPVFGHLQSITDPIDAVVIATPSQSHYALAEQALQRGLHVLMEKPLAARLEDAQALIKLAKQTGRTLQVGHVERFNPCVQRALELVDRPLYMVAERLTAFSGRGFDINVVLDLMIHDLDLAGQLFSASLQEVRAVGLAVITREIDMASARLAFADGTVAQLSAGRTSISPSRKIRIFTMSQYLSLDCVERSLKVVTKLPGEITNQEDLANHMQVSWPAIPQQDALASQLDAFIQCVLLGHQPTVDAQSALRTLKWAFAVVENMRASPQMVMQAS